MEEKRHSSSCFGDDRHAYSQNVGENGWSWNARDDGGTGTLAPTGSGNNIADLDALDSVRSVAVASGADLLADVLGRLESDLFGAFQDNSMRQAVDAYQEIFFAA